MSSTFGKIFQISTFGESHGNGIGVVIDGCPPLLEISAEEIQKELDRRRPANATFRRREMQPTKSKFSRDRLKEKPRERRSRFS